MPPALFAAKDLSPDGELFRGATLSLCSHAPHVAQSLSSDCGHWSGPVWANAEGGKTLSLCVPACGMQRIFTQFKKHPPAFIPIGCCLYRHTESMRGSKTGCMPGASLHPRELSRAFERDGSYSLAEKRHANSGMRTLGPMPAFQTAQDEGRTRERIPSSSISTRKPTCNELAPCLVCARVSHK